MKIIYEVINGVLTKQASDWAEAVKLAKHLTRVFNEEFVIEEKEEEGINTVVNGQHIGAKL